MYYSHSTKGRLYDALLQLFGGESLRGPVLLFNYLCGPFLLVNICLRVLQLQIKLSSHTLVIWGWGCSFEMRGASQLRVASWLLDNRRPVENDTKNLDRIDVLSCSYPEPRDMVGAIQQYCIDRWKKDPLSEGIPWINTQILPECLFGICDVNHLHDD